MKKFVSMCLTAVMSIGIFAGVAGAESNVGQSGLYDVGGHHLYANIQGQLNGSPAVVFESGYGGDSTEWTAVQATVSQQTLTVSYDRAGLGQSEDSGKDKTVQEQVEELHKLLDAANIPAPYVLVGHSLGGVNARVYADTYPSEVAAVVLVDATHELQEEKMVYPYLPEEMRELYFSQFTAEGNHDTFAASLAYVAQIRQNDALRNTPITVIRATEHDSGAEAEAAWAELQQDQLTLSNDNKEVVAQGNGHAVHVENPTLVSNEVLDIFNRL